MGLHHHYIIENSLNYGSCREVYIIITSSLEANSQCTDCNEFDDAMVVDFGHLFGFSEEVFHLLAMLAMAGYEVTHCGRREGGERGERERK